MKPYDFLPIPIIKYYLNDKLTCDVPCRVSLSVILLEFVMYSVQCGYDSDDKDLNGFSGTWQFLWVLKFTRNLDSLRWVLRTVPCRQQNCRCRPTEHYTSQCLWSSNLSAYCSLVSPRKPAELKFKDIAEIVQKHHDPKPSIIVQCYRFNTGYHHVGESVSTYVAELRQLSNHCDFGPSLQQMLWDRLVCDIEDPKIQWRLLAEPDLTFDKAFKLALASESTNQNAKDLQATKSPQILLNRMQIKQSKPCYRWGGNHKAIDCPHKSSECHMCGKKRHLAHVCGAKNQ